MPRFVSAALDPKNGVKRRANRARMVIFWNMLFVFSRYIWLKLILKIKNRTKIRLQGE
jgi:hypothetical protein